MDDRSSSAAVPASRPSRGGAPFDLREAARRAAHHAGSAELALGAEPVVLRGDPSAWERGLVDAVDWLRALGGGPPTIAVWRVRSTWWLEVRGADRRPPVAGWESGAPRALASLASELGAALATSWDDGRGPTLVLRATLAAPVEPEPGDGARLRVLLIDDEPLVRRGIARLLGRRHEVVEADDEAAAAAVLAERAVDVVLCDLHLGATSGLEVLRRLRPVAPAARLVTMSGYLDPVVADAVRAASDGFLQKPFTLAEFGALAAPAAASRVG